MNYILIGLLLSIGWTLGASIMETVGWLINRTVRRSKFFDEGMKYLYNTGDQQGSRKEPKNKIGF